MNVQACPEDEYLAAHLLGRLQGERAEQLDVHLQSCESCLQRAKRLEPNDQLTKALGSGLLDLSGEPSLQREVAEKAYTLRATSDTTTGCDTSAGFDRDGSESTADISFLSPAEESDELGRLGHYRILGWLGAGGMGVVFRAEDTRLARQVALKAMKPEIAATKTARERFLREARATAAIDHDNIVTIHQVDEEAGIPYLAMRLLQGESLQDRLETTGKLPIADVLRIGREVASGLAAAHAQGLIHRDIKPDNIWLERRTGSANVDSSQPAAMSQGDAIPERVKIVDFGLARAIDDIELTRTGTLMGTPRYMSPEQAQGKSVDHRSDLFSLGAVVYHMLTGVGPFDRNNLTATLLAVTHDEPDRIESHREGVPKQLSILICQLLEKDPEKRTHSAATVVSAFAEIERQSTEEPTIEAQEELRGVSPGIAASHPPQATRRDRNRRWLLIGSALIAPLILALGIALIVRTAEGTLRVEINDENLEVLVDGDSIAITGNAWQGKEKARVHGLGLKLKGIEIPFDEDSQTFRAENGNVTVRLGEVELRSRQFEVSRSGTTVLRIRFQPKEAIRGVDANLSQGNRNGLGHNIDDRKVAEQIVGFGGSVRLVDGKSWIWTLPEGDLRIEGVSFFRKQKQFDNEHLALLAQLPKLQTVCCYPNLMTDEGYATLAEMKNVVENVRELHFLRTAIGPKGLAALTKLKRLEILTLSHTNLVNEDLKLLSNMPSLRELTLKQHTKRKFGPAFLTDECLIHLKTVGGLRKLTLIGETFTDASLVAVAELEGLQDVWLATPNITDGAIEKLKQRRPRLGVTEFKEAEDE